ncbi:MAG: guanine deaminase [Pseudomonadota bacterium]
MSSTVAVRGRIAHCERRPDSTGGVAYFDDGALIVDNGVIAACGPAKEILPAETQLEVMDHGRNLIVPGLIDCHVHYPQTDIIASFGEQLLSWLENYTFPEEARFADLAHARDTAEFFVRELLRNGTTTALVFATVHPGSVDALFEAAARFNMRIAAGKVLMDRHSPDNLRDTPETAYTESRALIERWHGNGRAVYAITPRFAATSSPEQLDAAGRLHREFPDTLVHTHLAENHDEIAWIAEMYPDSRSYLDVYVSHGLVGPHSVFAHGIHLDDEDRRVMGEAGSAIAFCPTSNLFLGSGLFDWQAANNAHIEVGVGTDVGGGTSFSLLKTLAEAYKVLQMKRQTLASRDALYLATLGGARALSMDDKIGNFEPGKEADFIVLDVAATPLIERRLARVDTLDDELFVQWMLGDDRSVAATYVAGRLAHRNTEGTTELT